MAMHKELRRLWKDAGYRGTMGSAEVVSPPPPQFIRVYHITSAEYGISNIGLHRLKVARFMDLNDPFELMALNVRDKPTRKRLAEFKATYDSKMGLLCFSENWVNPVLWSHYGNKHRGICLGFDLRRERQEPICYCDERIQAELDDDNVTVTEEIKTQLLRTKFAHWKYEEERRVVVQLDDPKLRREANLHFYPFDEDLVLREVIIGPNCAVPLDALRRLVDQAYGGVTTFKARLAVKSFDVVPLEKTVP